jgi:tetratricopeptide (TPR) repeat protein
MMEVCTALNPGISSYEDTYAWVFYQSKYYDKALEWIQKALASGGDNSATIVEHYGDILYQLGRTTEALTQWKLAKELGSDTPFIDQKIAEQKLYE